MAKKSDQRVGGYEAENTGGVLSGLLADEEHLDRRGMFRLGSWGVASVGAVVVAVLANQSGMRSRHDQIAALDLTRQSQQIQSVARESQNETRRLASAIDTLNSDRDRLYSRLTTLEQGLESATGAIAKQSAAAVAPPVSSPAAASAAQPVTQAATPEPVAQNTPPEPAPIVAPVTTVAAIAPKAERGTPEKSRGESRKSTLPAAAPVAALAPSSPAPATVAAVPQPVPAPPNPPATSSAEPPMAAKSIVAPPDTAAAKPIEPEPSAKTASVTPPPAPPAPAPMMTPTASAPERVATPHAADKVATAEPTQSASPPLAVKRTEFGVDVGGANSVGGLRALWRGLLKWRGSAGLAGLQPIIVVKEGNNGLGMQLRLVAGPLNDAASAARICAAMTASDRHCETTVFDGQRLALGPNDAPPVTTAAISAKPSSEKSAPEPASEKAEPDTSSPDKAAAKPGSQNFHRRYSYAKRVKQPEPPPPPPAPSSGLSWFGSRSQ